ncbi:Uncharacterised protein [Serratia liquefaciens]|nr:Uncharacterised protein [Serratia liquefaciens]
MIHFYVIKIFPAECKEKSYIKVALISNNATSQHAHHYGKTEIS